jgi:hypothetical protein
MIFDPGNHQYCEDDGTPIPSVTQIIKAAGVIDDRWYTTESRDKGTAAHRLCERYAEGERDDRHGRPLRGIPYVNAFANWVDGCYPYAIATECKIYHRLNSRAYAGTFDLLAKIEGKRTLIDIKTGASAKWHAVQLAAYAMARIVDKAGKVTDQLVNPERCAVLYLKADGKYRYMPIPGGRLVEAIREFREYLSLP